MIIADEDQLLGVCWNVSAIGGSGLGPDVHSFAVRPVGPVDVLCEFLGKGYCLIQPFSGFPAFHVPAELQDGI